MRCTILALGTRGDVQPMIALGAGLRAAGFDVRCAAQEDFAGLVRQQGLELFPLAGRSAKLFAGQAGRALRERLREPREYRRFFDEYLLLLYEKQLAEIWEACRTADVVLCWPWTRVGPTLAEALRIPVFIVAMYPPLHLSTAEFANPFHQSHADATTPAAIRRTWRRTLPVMAVGQRAHARWRERLGVAPMGWRQDLRRLRTLPHLLGYSPVVLPRPRDWPARVHVTGYWWLDAPAVYDPPPALAAFLASGDPPIGIGFSSQVGPDTEAVNEIILEATARAGVRAVLIGGFSALPGGRMPGHICAVQSVPYDWLFSRVRAFVHQGGSGTVGSALRFGLPNLAVTFGYDQGLWGDRLHALGAGPPPIPLPELTADRLAAALRQLATDAAMRARASAIGSAIAREDGVGEAVRRIVAACRGGLQP